MSDKRTITLTERAPVTISEENWPLVASASDKEYDGEHEYQANRTSKWFVGYRQHTDGRGIVYATYSYSTALRGERDQSAKRGVLLDAGDDVIEAIQEVCTSMASAECNSDDCERWDTLMHEMIADLPAVDLDEADLLSSME